MRPPQRVVFDCNVFFQAFISATGPAGQLLSAVSDKTLTLFVSEFVLNELKDVLSRPHLVSQFKFTSQRVAEYLDSLVQLATMTADVPHVFEFPRDPKDAYQRPRRTSLRHSYQATERARSLGWYPLRTV